MLYSEEFDNAAWTKTDATVTANQTTSPSGYVDADKLIPSSGLQGILQQNHLITATQANTMSIFAKAGELNLITLANRDNASSSNSAIVTFDLLTGVISTAAAASGTYSAASATITNYGNGWYRLTLTFTSSASVTNRVRAFTDDSGDGTKGFFVWGAQFETNASYASSYIPTLGSTVTRLADACSKTGISSLIGQTQGTLFVEVDLSNNTSDVFRGIAELNDGTTANRITLFRNLNGTLRLFVRQSSASQADISYATLVTGSVKIAVAYANNDISFYVNGVQVGTDTSATIPTCSDFDLGIQEKNTDRILGDSINQTLLFKTRITNEQLQTLTSL